MSEQPKTVVTLGVNERPSWPILLGDKKKGFVEPTKFTGYYPIDPYHVYPNKWDILVNGQASTQDRYCNYPTPLLGWPTGENMEFNMVSEEEEFKKLDPVKRLKLSYDRFKEGILKNLWCVYRKVEFVPPAGVADKSIYLLELIENSEIIQAGDLILRGTFDRGYDEDDDEEEDATNPPVSGPIPLTKFREQGLVDDSTIITDACPDVGRMLVKLRVRREYGPYTKIYRIVIAGPYGISTRIPLNPIYSEPLPLP